MILKKISNIFLDYENEVLMINGTKVEDPVKIIIREPDGFDIAKLFNHESAKQGMMYAELTIDARDVASTLDKQDLKQIIRLVVETLGDMYPAKPKS